MSANPTPSTLPACVEPADLKYPTTGYLSYEAQKALGLDTEAITLYRTKSGWNVCCLLIRGKGRQATDRYYARGLSDQKLWTLGRGPHVLEEITVHVSAANAERLKPVIEAYVKGLGEAQAVRDRIGSRRAQGQLHREAGHTSWRW